MNNMKWASQWILVLDVLVSFIIVLSNSSAHVVADSNAPDAILIDCGVNESYMDPRNGFHYEADDEKYVESGKTYNVSSDYYTSEQIENQLNTLRSFPDGIRNCYTLKPEQGKNNNYLVRGYFAYGNYDNKSSVPIFDLYLGVNYWATIELGGIDYILRTEVIHMALTDNIDVCLVNTGNGIPYISLLELWPLPYSLYRPASSLLPLNLVTRTELGMTENVVFIRYSDDIYGRSWFNRNISGSVPIDASAAIDSDVSENTFKLPKEVLSTAVRSLNVDSSIVMDLQCDTSYDYYVYLHFYDFEERSQNQKRSMNINFADVSSVRLNLEFQKPKTIIQIIKKGDSLDRIYITSTVGSDLPAMLNAYEIYQVLPQNNATTHEEDVDALRQIKKFYNIMRVNWQGDPCMPINYTWEGLTCNSDRIPRVTSLRLSSSKLIGEINASFSHLIKLESLDLSNNQLTGEIPPFLAELPNLKLL